MNTRFTKAAADRQAALDYIIANPNAYGPEIIAAMGWHKSEGADRLRDLAGHGEVERTKAVMPIVNKNGHKAQLNTYTYTALVTKTRTADDISANLAANLSAVKKNLREIRNAIIKPEVRDPKRRPIPNQGGQGNHRHEVRRGCSLS